MSVEAIAIQERLEGVQGEFATFLFDPECSCGEAEVIEVYTTVESRDRQWTYSCLGCFGIRLITKFPIGI